MVRLVTESFLGLVVRQSYILRQRMTAVGTPVATPSPLMISLTHTLWLWRWWHVQLRVSPATIVVSIMKELKRLTLGAIYIII